MGDEGVMGERGKSDRKVREQNNGHHHSTTTLPPRKYKERGMSVGNETDTFHHYHF